MDTKQKKPRKRRGEKVNVAESLDRFLPPTVVKPKQDPSIFVEERCSNPKCRKILSVKVPKYTLRSKGREQPYCPDCAKQILRPQENTEGNI